MKSVFRPPTARYTLGVLDRALFAKTVNLAAVSVADKKKIAQWRQKLQAERTLLSAERLSCVVAHPDQTLASQGMRCLLLDPKVRPRGKQTLDYDRHEGIPSLSSDLTPCA